MQGNIVIIWLCLITKTVEMKKTGLLLLSLLYSLHLFAQQQSFITRFEKSGGTETATYEETIEFYTELAEKYEEIEIRTIGMTDAGKPLHIITLNPDGKFNFNKIRKSKRILLINNGIHPGESDGIDATMLFFRDIVQGKIKAPEHTVLVTIPIYNIGGAINRNSTTRTNQNGPKAYGFRGNARNYDLNRDFIKCDTENARSFVKIFHMIQPDVFIDNHVSNGADYQYTLTHLFTQHDKMGGTLGKYLKEYFMPEIEKRLSNKNWDITPYVNLFNRVPETGFSQFLDLPRYSTGFTTLFNTLGMMVETHMLKPYQQRVTGTYELMKSILELVEEEGEKLRRLRNETISGFQRMKTYPLQWEIDSARTSTLQFKGFEGEWTRSSLTEQQSLRYNRKRPFEKPVTYFDHFKPVLEVSIPKAYVIPQGWHPVIELLEFNKVSLNRFDKDTILKVESYRIVSFETRKMPYEGHYAHYNTTISSEEKKVNFHEGDYIVYTDQPAIRYLLETLEPQAPDSFFNWNFFDTILQRKEYFSPYVWEDKAMEMLKNDAQLKQVFETKKTKEPDFSKNWYAQLDWLHKQSEHYEKSHMQYPVYRIMN